MNTLVLCIYHPCGASIGKEMTNFCSAVVQVRFREAGVSDDDTFYCRVTTSKPPFTTFCTNVGCWIFVLWNHIWNDLGEPSSWLRPQKHECIILWRISSVCEAQCGDWVKWKVLMPGSTVVILRPLNCNGVFSMSDEVTMC